MLLAPRVAEFNTGIWQVRTKAASRVLFWYAAAAIPCHAQIALKPTDLQLKLAIEGQLIEAVGIDANAIDIDVAKGVATLSGEVANVLSEDRAIRTAEVMPGITAVQDRLTVKDTGRSDPEISEDLSMAFAANPATDVWEIDVEVDDGAVTLTGWVQSANEGVLATSVAKSVAGVRSVVNDLQIEARGTRADAEIASEIEEIIHWDVRVDDALIDVAVEDGLAMLSGAVGSVHEKKLAIQHAWTSGAVAVDADGLEVLWLRRDEIERRTPWAELANDAVAAAVERAVQRDARVAGFDLRADAQDRTITLTGVVDNYQAKQTAGEVARSVVGVERVLNYTKVRPELALTDDEVAATARAAIARDPIIARSGITLLVFDGGAKLYGVVDGAFERAHAEAVVAGINGVVDVQNYLATYESTEEASADFLAEWPPRPHRSR